MNHVVEESKYLFTARITELNLANWFVFVVLDY